MATVKQSKHVAALPSVLTADTIYYVRVGTGFDIYVTNATGMIAAYEANYVKKVDGKDLSSNDYTDEDKAKLAQMSTVVPLFVPGYRRNGSQVRMLLETSSRLPAYTRSGATLLIQVLPNG